MEIETWIAYALATELVLIIPGPTVLLVVGYALSRGRLPALQCVLGSCGGIILAFTAAFAGLGALLAASATAYIIVKWAGALYLIWLGVKMWRARPDDFQISESDARIPSKNGLRGSPVVHGFVTTILNPKVVVFLIAFVPQFMDNAAPALPQAIILTATFVILAALSDGAYAIVASRARGLFVNAKTARLMNRIGGSFLIGAGIFTAAVRRSG